jgi:hypothetical protein
VSLFVSLVGLIFASLAETLVAGHRLFSQSPERITLVYEKGNHSFVAHSPKRESI